MDTSAFVSQAPLVLAVLALLWAGAKAVKFGVKAAVFPFKVALLLLVVGAVALAFDG